MLVSDRIDELRQNQYELFGGPFDGSHFACDPRYHGPPRSIVIEVREGVMSAEGATPTKTLRYDLDAHYDDYGPADLYYRYVEQ